MTAPNFTGDGQQETFEDLLCSPDLTVGLHGHLTFLSVLNSFLSVTTFLGNSLILIALHKETSLHPPSKFLLRSLATSDLCVGVFAEPLAVSCWMSVVNKHWTIGPYLGAGTAIISVILCGVSVATLTAISVDRLLALCVGTEIQTSCNFKANLRNRVYLMGFARCHFSNFVLESSYILLAHVCHHRYYTVPNNPCILLHKDFLHPPSSSKSSTRPCSTTEPNKSTEHSEIQKGSVQCNMAATGAGRLLSSLFHIYSDFFAC